MQFEEDQLEFINFIKNGVNKGLVVLNAPAGTGKTTVAKYLNTILKNKVVVDFLAPTHKAVGILNKDGPINVSTIHRFLQSKLTYSDNGEQIFTFTPPNKKNNIIFVDECSMVNNSMYEAFNNMSTNNLIVYMGDDLQLPPINSENIDEDKQIKKESKISKTFNIETKFEFKKNQRSKKFTSTIMLQLAREACYSKKMPPKIASMNMTEILKYFKDYQNTDKTVIILAFTNVAITNYNKIIRSYLFNVKEKDLEPFYINENLVLGSLMRVVDDYKYVSSDIIKIKDVTKETLTLKFDNFQCKCKDEQYNKVKCKEHQFRKGSMDIEFYKIIDDRNTIWYQPINKKQFNIMSWQYRQYCIMNKNNWKEYYEFMNFYNADLKYEYAQTIHKSQGSQYNIVFVDRQNLIGCTSRDTTLRINGYYTAISRMQDEVYDIEKEDSPIG